LDDLRVPRNIRAVDAPTAVPTYETPRGAVDLQRFGTEHPRVVVGPHGHRDLELLYFERGGGEHRVGAHTWPVREGDLVLIAPGQVHDLAGMGADAVGWAVEFSPQDIRDLRVDAPSLLLWRANPLLNPFVAAEVDPDVGRFRVPEADRGRWVGRLHDLGRELHDQPAGHDSAVAALVLLLLIEVARLAEDVAGTMRARDQPLLARVFEIIDARYAERLTLRDVAAEVGLTGGHLTTVVRERTGRTVLDWILERRLTAARSLLLGSELTVEAIAQRVGFEDPAYFSRRFRLVHGCAPGAWRRAAGG
jgi:AraC family transcriptional activator of pobA